MRNDPRDRNEWCDASSMASYLREYAARLEQALMSVDPAAMEQARDLIEGAAAGGASIYSIGNGGSAAIADHLCCDLTKGTHTDQHPTIAAFSLVSNVPLYTAAANDFGFEHAFSAQIDMLAKPGDVVLAVSSSGNSPNILRAVEAAKAKGLSTIGLSGFAGGKLKEIADVSLYVAENNYGLVEDAHQALMHVFAQFIACQRN